MMRRIAPLIVALLLLAMAGLAANRAHAQQPQITAAEVQARINVLIRQREAALNESVALAAALELTQKRVEELEKKCGEKCAPPAPKKK